MRRIARIGALAAALAGSPAAAIDAPATCARIAAAAETHGLPKPFLARLIWTESRFDPKAVSPKGALGVAQFIPETAARRGLADPFDRDAAIMAAAAYLADLRRDFGNLGLAAAAYNAGERRVADWLAGRGGLPAETRRYVPAVTGETAETFRARDRAARIAPLAGDTPFAEACAALPTMRLRAPRHPWAVEVAGGLTEGAARRTYARLERAYGPLFADYDLMIRRNPHRARGAWSVRLGAPSWGLAFRLCERLRGRGGYCRVMRN